MFSLGAPGLICWLLAPSGGLRSRCTPPAPRCSSGGRWLCAWSGGHGCTQAEQTLPRGAVSWGEVRTVHTQGRGAYRSRGTLGRTGGGAGVVRPGNGGRGLAVLEVTRVDLTVTYI